MHRNILAAKGSRSRGVWEVTPSRLRLDRSRVYHRPRNGRKPRRHQRRGFICARRPARRLDRGQSRVGRRDGDSSQLARLYRRSKTEKGDLSKASRWIELRDVVLPSVGRSISSRRQAGGGRLTITGSCNFSRSSGGLLSAEADVGDLVRRGSIGRRAFQAPIWWSLCPRAAFSEPSYIRTFRQCRDQRSRLQTAAQGADFPSHLTRQIAPPSSSVTSNAPSFVTATSTGRPQTLSSSATKPVRKSS
jgi:hypothetical protein